MPRSTEGAAAPARLAPAPADHAAPPTQRLARVCIVSQEFNGPSRNGGIGTAYTALAELLAGAGHPVTVLYLPGAVGAWGDHYRRRNIDLVALPDAPCPLGGSEALAASYRVYLWLRERRFDVVHFHEWLAAGYYSLLARRQGLAFAGTTFCVGLHSPTRWLHEANGLFLDDLDVLERDALERRCVALADEVWSPSHYMLDWVRERGWDTPRPFV